MRNSKQDDKPFYKKVDESKFEQTKTNKVGSAADTGKQNHNSTRI